MLKIEKQAGTDESNSRNNRPLIGCLHNFSNHKFILRCAVISKSITEAKEEIIQKNVFRQQDLILKFEFQKLNQVQPSLVLLVQYVLAPKQSNKIKKEFISVVTSLAHRWRKLAFGGLSIELEFRYPKIFLSNFIMLSLN